MKSVLLLFVLLDPNAILAQDAPPESRPAEVSPEGAPPSGPEMLIRGFADVGFRAGQGMPSSFSLGQLDLFVTSRLSDDFSVLGEIVFKTVEDNDFHIEVERLLLRYTPSEFLNLSAGRYHTAIGYYNTTYHHGTWFETAASRPFLFAFADRGVLPIHNVGLSATGRIPSGRAGLRYIVELGNGRASHAGAHPPVQNAMDENSRKAVNLGIASRPPAWPGLQAGVSAYFDRLEPDGRARVSETIAAVYLVYQDDRWEWLSEAIGVRHAPEDAAAQRSWGLYVQGARRFKRLQPYLRYQYFDGAAADPILGPLGRRYGPSIGICYDAGDFVALKAQFDRTERRGLPARNGVVMQAAFTF